jgi:hypothetical protein
VVETNLRVPRPLEVKGIGIIGVGGVADEEACTVHTANIIFYWQYFVASCLRSYVGNVFGLHSRSIFVCFTSDIGEMHSLVPAAVHPVDGSK